MRTGVKFGVACLLLVTETFAQQPPSPKLGKSSIKEVIAAMTIDEKVNFVKGIGMSFSNGENGPVVGEILGRVPGAAGATMEIARLGIPSIVVADGPAGLRIDPKRREDPKTYYATAFPVGTALASTWNTPLVENVGKAMGNEVLEYGVDIILAPGMNIQRNPLCGRNFEYYSEDPLLTGKIGAAMIKGIQANGVGVSVKHFAANNQETSRNYINEIISERALREIYLKGFEIAVKSSQPWTVMSSYNKINGTYSSENYELLTTVLRNEWGFKGFVMTDWFAGRNYPNQLKAGNDLLMPGRPAELKRIKEALDNKTLSESDLDRNIERILAVIVESPAFKAHKYKNNPDLTAHAAIVRAAAAEGMVLLKNENNALPLKIKKIALLGNASYDTFGGGSGSGEVNKAYTTSFYEGLDKQGFIINDALKNDYLSYLDAAKKAQPVRLNIMKVIKPLEEKEITLDTLQQLAQNNDIAILTIGRNAGEGYDRNVNTDYYLSQKEISLIENCSKVFHEQHKKLVVVLNIDAVIDVEKWQKWADAILLSWLPGQEAGNAIADVVSGKVNPSGHLAQSFPRSYSDVPSAKSFPGTPEGHENTSVYNEGIYVGYRYYNSFKIPVTYEFGYGLSYTTFKIDNIRINSPVFSNTLEVGVNIKNTGKIAGKEVVQLYISAPGKTFNKAASELRAFEKTKLLLPGQFQKLLFTIHSMDLASFDSSRNAWVVEPGTYTVKIGNSCNNILQIKTVRVQKEIVVEKVNDVLKAIDNIDELNK